ncbi:MAG TPA: hypothetical protein PKW35_13150, partial [Nannocystaceae bacterium]|nr:hypothetical protein [Nannocystaceae bacterium]
AELPREGGPLWPLDDDDRTAAALAQKFATLGPVRDHDDLGWSGASDAFLAKWWARFAEPLAAAFASAWQPSLVPVVDDDGLAIASGPEVRATNLIPPTREGWKTYLALAPRSGESFTKLRDLGLAWWSRKIPQDLLAEARREREAEDTEPPATQAAEDMPPKTGTPATRTARATTTPRTVTPAGSDVSPETSAARLAKGAAIEAAEHPELPPAVAEQIAADHLRADPTHYDNAPTPDTSEEKALYRCRRCGVRLDKPAEHVAIWVDGKPIMCVAGTNEFEKIPLDTPPDIVHLSAGAKARRAQAEAEEVARIERIAGNDAGLRDLALQLGDLADPIEKTPTEIADWFQAKGYGRIATWIHNYLDEGGPYGGLLEEIADVLRESNDDDDVTADADGLIVPLDTIESDAGRDYVVRQDPEGVSRRYIKRRAPVLDEDGEETAHLHVRDYDLADSEGQPLKKGDHLLNFHYSRFKEPYLRERWRHYQMLAKALRRAPLEIERTRQLLVYAAVLVRAPKCKGPARAAAKRALELAIREHRAAAEAFTTSGWTTSDFTPGKAVERLARVARHLARLAHEVAQSCADGQVLLVDPDFAVPEDISEAQDQPTPLEVTDDEDDIYRAITPTALQALSPNPTPAATRTIEAALDKTLRTRRRA